ncbi:MAG: nicotinamide mononucleotide transporter [Bacteroidales bacterium]|nr:nicotinamide mononucleotide transporter [Bacteroidales bacterium]
MLLFAREFSDFAPQVMQWLSVNYIELLATLTGLIYIIFSVRGKMLLWLFGFISSALFVIVFFRSRIYADMGINVYYVLVSIYGWFHWKYDKKRNQKTLPYARLDFRTALYLLGVSILVFIFIAFILDKLTDSDIPLPDAFTTAFSITATWMLARKIIEQWLIWIVVDLVSAGLYIYKELYPSVLLFLTYTVLAYVGYKTWVREWKIQENIK